MKYGKTFYSRHTQANIGCSEVRSVLYTGIDLEVSSTLKITDLVDKYCKMHVFYRHKRSKVSCIIYIMTWDGETMALDITKTCLYNFDPTPTLKPHFYIVKMMFTGIYIIFLISAKKT